MVLQADRMLKALWAKKDDKGGNLCWLPLMTHLDDTMRVARWLWVNWISDGQRAFCIRSIEPANEETAMNLAGFLGAVHDIGKATPVFQTQRGYCNSMDLDRILLEKLERAGFCGISSLQLTEPSKSHHTIAGEYLLSNIFQVNDDISSIIGSHHGKPVDNRTDVDDEKFYLSNLYQSEDCDSDVYHKWEVVQKNIFDWALHENGFICVEQLPKLTEPAQVIYSGLIIMADWIASNSSYFPLISVNEIDAGEPENRFRTGMLKWGINLPFQIQSCANADELFENRFGFGPVDFQRKVCETAESISEPGIMILEAPMGIGKTEAALGAAEELASITERSGLFFGLPTQATSNGMFTRVECWLKNVTSAYGVKQSLRLCHGKAALNEEMNHLREQSEARGVDVDDEEDGNVYVNEWFSGRKKTMLDDYVVGTVDNFLLLALKQKHLALRHLGFSKKVVIIDEVHAYDVYMQQYLEEALKWMGAYGTPVILLSATLPVKKRQELITAYLRGMGVRKRDIVFPADIQSLSYPIISYTDGKEVRAVTQFLPMKERTVKIKKLRDEDLLMTVEDLLEDGGVAGIIVNTVRRAQTLGAELAKRFGEDAVEVLHSSFIATDRIAKENNLLATIGKNGNRPKKKIIIGTQVIEQSLDIDFDVLISDLCPMDLLLQRIGRLHRHVIDRPHLLAEPVAYILGTEDDLGFEKGSEHIYGTYFLTRTQYFLPEQISIPSDIPKLIEKVYGEEKITFSDSRQAIYERSVDQMEALRKNKRDKAIAYKLDDPREKDNLIGWLKNPDTSPCEETAMAQVRDVVETIEVIAVKKIGDGYGVFDSLEDLSGRIDESHIAKLIAKQTLRLPNYVSSRNGVTKTINFLEEYNKSNLRAWQNQAWLRGTLGIIFDEKGYFNLDGITLKYDTTYGLREVKDNGEI